MQPTPTLPAIAATLTFATFCLVYGTKFLPNGNRLLSLTTPSTAATADGSRTPIPNGFAVTTTSPGVSVYRRNDGVQTYVTAMDFDRGDLRNLTGEVTSAAAGSVCGRSTCERLQVGQRLLSEYWQQAQDNLPAGKQPKVVINGTFFARYNKPTGIAFGLKANDRIINYGYGLNEFPGLNRTIAWNSSQKTIEIADYRRSTFDSSFPDIVGALNPQAGKHRNRFLPRTFLGINGRKIFIFSSNYARQSDAVNTLQQFGAEKIVMLDGGGSTGLIVDGQEILKTNTRVPHAIALYSDL
jgi:hypothetical protein